LNCVRRKIVANVKTARFFSSISMRAAGGTAVFLTLSANYVASKHKLHITLMDGSAGATSLSAVAPCCVVCRDITSGAAVFIPSRDLFIDESGAVGLCPVHPTTAVQCAACSSSICSSCGSMGAARMRSTSSSAGGAALLPAAGAGRERAAPKRLTAALSKADASLLFSLRCRVQRGVCETCKACPRECCQAYDVGKYLRALEVELARRAVVRKRARTRRALMMGREPPASAGAKVDDVSGPAAGSARAAAVKGGRSV